ncbi:uncharacterized protein LOC126889933 [Diabrotica virgifera virgifera]|uniref:Uncharacterized protein n=1 Tax=Diabrotica virgifera virgifera TaxID=50390 RepID=A0ABM5KWR8_DIAVI|nr:uncharacterized protein LOC126889933 [Diabrotica virgifera virgifera]
MAPTSGARAELRAVLSENSSLNVNFIDDRDDSVADKDYKPSGDDFPSQSSEDELQEPIPRLFKDKEVNSEKKKPTRWRQRNEEHYDRNERKRSRNSGQQYTSKKTKTIISSREIGEENSVLRKGRPAIIELSNIPKKYNEPLKIAKNKLDKIKSLFISRQCTTLFIIS